MEKRDLISGIFFLFVGVFFLTGSFRYPIWDRYGPGAGFFPLVLGLLFSLLCVFLLVGTVVKRIRSRGEVSIAEGLAFTEKKRFFLCLVFFVCFYLFFESLGFFITVFGYLLGVLLLLGRRSFRLSLLISVIACVFVYGVFVYALGVQLPLGVLRDFIFSHLLY